jgi:hypothetical protein
LSSGGSLPTSLQQVTLQTVSYQASTCASIISNWTYQLCAGASGKGTSFFLSFFIDYFSL